MSMPPSDPRIPEPIEIGKPDGPHPTWDGPQSYPDTCAIRCQEYILEVITGQEFDEDQLVQEALDEGWYIPGMGTPVEHVGKLLELYGVSAKRCWNASIFHLANELSQGHQVIVGVDSSELQKNPILGGLLSEALDKLGLAEADHAVVVTGIKTTPKGETFVVIADPGTGEPAAEYPLEQFLYAWQDSNCFLVATAQWAPREAPGMEFFNYDKGHLDTIAGIDLENIFPIPEDWETFLPLLERLAHIGIHLLFAYLKAHLTETEPELQKPLVDPPSPEDLPLLPDGALDQLQQLPWTTELLVDWGWIDPPDEEAPPPGGTFPRGDEPDLDPPFDQGLDSDDSGDFYPE